MNWTELADWWRAEVRQDPAYEEVVTRLLFQVLQPRGGGLYLDLGCGEGRVMRSVEAAGAFAHGIDLSSDLLTGLNRVAVAHLPTIPLRTETYDGVYCVLTLEHIEDHTTLFAEASRVVKPQGVLALVMNHPQWTAPGSTPITDEDGEVLWRPGDYFSDGVTKLRTGESEVVFYHRSTSELLNAASASDWSLERMVELPHHELDEQADIPRLMACRWIKRAGS